MISFKSYLTESRSAPLYHGTETLNGIEILYDNVMNTGKLREPGLDKQTVSLTRDFTFARNWISEKGFVSGVIFEFDQRKLAQRYKIVPYSFFGQKVMGYMKSAREMPNSRVHTNAKGKNYNFNNQFEEAVIGPIKNVKSYITKLWIDDMDDIEFEPFDIPLYSYITKKRIK